MSLGGAKISAQKSSEIIIKLLLHTQPTFLP